MHQHHHHESAPSSLKVAFYLNMVFTVIEIIGGIFTNSVAILSDALHDLGDSLSLGLSWYLQKVSKKKRDEKYTYGYRRFSLLGAFINSSVLIVGSGVILFEAVPRLFNPQTPDVKGMILLAILGIVFNGVAVFRLKAGKTMNEKVAAWHLLEDVLGWVSILLISLTMLFWHLPILDPLFSVFFTLFILYNVVRNFRQTIKIFLQAKPDEMDTRNLENELKEIQGVLSAHDIHIWSMDGEYYVLTVHVVVADEVSNTEVLDIKNQARETCCKLGVAHVTIEIEYESEICALKDC